jgi:hypothetical protein
MTVEEGRVVGVACVDAGRALQEVEVEERC